MSFWNNLSLNTKIVIFICVLLVNIGAPGYMFLSASKSMKRDIASTDKLARIANMLLDREINYLKWSNSLQAYAFTPSATKLPVESDPTKCAFGKWYYGSERVAVQTEFFSIADDLASIESPHSALHASASMIEGIRQNGDQGKVIDTYKNVSMKELDAVQKTLSKVIATINELKEQNKIAFTGQLEKTTNSTYKMIGFAIGLSSVLALFVSRNIVTPTIAIADFARKVAGGDLSAQIDIRRKDEIGVLADALRAIPETLGGITNSYKKLEQSIVRGNLAETLNVEDSHGDYRNLMEGTNSIMARFLAVLENLPSPVVMLDENLNISYLNAKGQELVGKEFIGHKTPTLFKCENAHALEKNIENTVSQGASSQEEAHAVINNRKMYFHCTTIPFHDSTGKLTSVLQLITDLTSVKETEQLIIAVAKEAQFIAESVADASSCLSRQIDQVSIGTLTQRDNAASTAAAMEQMTFTVLEVAKNAAQASAQAEATRVKAVEGADLVNQAVAAIEAINAAAEKMGHNMSQLGEQAEEIGNVLNIISDIADQTNLLTLNAAIEAARAGDAGRGFAIVADEVRKLAEKTMGATTEVDKSVRHIQAGTAASIAQSKEAAASICHAAEVFSTSGSALAEIVSLANINSRLISSIATAAEQQSATSEEINRSVDGITQIIAETSSEMGVSAASVQTLAEMSRRLKAILDTLDNTSKKALEDAAALGYSGECAL